MKWERSCGDLTKSPWELYQPDLSKCVLYKLVWGETYRSPPIAPFTGVKGYCVTINTGSRVTLNLITKQRV